jgi:hypothetical protein
LSVLIATKLKFAAKAALMEKSIPVEAESAKKFKGLRRAVAPVDLDLSLSSDAVSITRAFEYLRAAAFVGHDLFIAETPRDWVGEHVEILKLQALNSLGPRFDVKKFAT